MTREEALEKLKAAGISNANTDVRKLFEHAYRGTGEKVGHQDWDKPNIVTTTVFTNYIHERLLGKPVAQIIGGRHFWKSWIQITSDVLDPRPETETLIDAALETSFHQVLDLGTGSGCILVSLLRERPLAKGIGTDISEKALSVAETNARFYKIDNRADFKISNWFENIAGKFDLIVSNPPYIGADEMENLQREVIDHEPRIALTDEGDGLAAYRAISEKVMKHLAPNGRLMVEIGPTQAKAVSKFFQDAGLVGIHVRPDLDGRDRVVIGRASA